MKATASIFGISIRQFLPAVTVGLMPYNWLTTSAGSLLATLSSKEQVFDRRTTLTLTAVSGVGMVLVCLKRRWSPHARARATAEAARKKVDDDVSVCDGV